MQASFSSLTSNTTSSRALVCRGYAGYRSRMIHETNEDKRTALLHVCLEYLERYYVLIAFVAFMMEPDLESKAPQQPDFGQWMACRPELKRCCALMLTAVSCVVLLPALCVAIDMRMQAAGGHAGP